jgi:predicted aspartyl protease
MLTINCVAQKSPRRMAQIIFLSSLFIFPCSSFPQAAAGETSTTIKVQVVSNLIVMPAYVNNSDKLEAVLDTGASQNVLMRGLALKLNLHPTVTAQAKGIGKGQDETMHISSGARLAWGYNRQLTLDDQNVGALPIDYVSQQTGQQVDAIFGSSLFQHFRIRVDYEHSEVTFTSGSGPSTSGTAIPIMFCGNAPYVEATFETATGEKVSARFLVDSGTAGDLILSRKFLDSHPSITKGHLFVNTPPVTAVGGSIQLELLRITGLDLGRFHLAAPVAAVPSSVLGALADHNIAGFIGAGILSRFTVDWDYARKTMTLSPNQRYGEPFEADASGMRLVAEGPDWKMIRVAAVNATGPSAEAGLKAGDVLTSVDGKVPPRLFELKKLLSHPGSSISFTILRSGKQSTMTIHLRRLV